MRVQGERDGDDFTPFLAVVSTPRHPDYYGAPYIRHTRCLGITESGSAAPSVLAGFS